MPHPIRPRPTASDRRIEADVRMLVHRRDGGVRVYFRHHRNRFTWDGRGTLAPNGPTYESALHDVAHWLAATRAQRRMPEFGLGPDPYRPDSGAYPVVEFGGAIEAVVCQLQVALVVALDIDDRAVADETGARWEDIDLLALRRRHPRALPPAGWAYVRGVLRARTHPKAPTP